VGRAKGQRRRQKALGRDSLTRDQLKDFVRPKITSGEPTVDNIAATFFALKGLAAFDGGSAAPPAPSATGVAAPVASATPAVSVVPESGAVNVSINLSLELPATSDGDVYDKLFEAMGKHLGKLLKSGGS
jgi:hypothetical protein